MNSIYILALIDTIVILIIIVILLFLWLRQILDNIKKAERNLDNILTNESSRQIVIKDQSLKNLLFKMVDVMHTHEAIVTSLKKDIEAQQIVLTSLSHDVRTPLASLIGYLEALQQNLVTEKDKTEYLLVATKKAYYLKSFTDDLFEWFKLCNTNGIALSIEEIDINELTRNIIIDWLPLLSKREIKLYADIQDDEIKLNIDKNAYTRIINNIIQNTIMHSQCSQINVSVEEMTSYVKVIIKDNGIGIENVDLPFIFDWLYKSDKTRGGKGSGLGLAIAKQLVNTMGGNINAESTYGEETVFFISFPKERSH